jgi:mono/diheme cytochrome c family protein
MGKWGRRVGLTLLVLLVLAIALVVIGNELAQQKLERNISVPSATIDIKTEPDRIAVGRYLYATRGCAECHGANGAGKEVFSEGDMLVVAPNITRGANSATTSYKAVDFDRTLRHGVKPSGAPVMMMPSDNVSRLTDDDAAALIAYVQQLPPVVGRDAVVQLSLAVRLEYGFGLIGDAASRIDHTLPAPQPVPVAVSVAHGAYLANACVRCHGAHLSGGKVPDAPGWWPVSANLTPGKGSAMPRYPTPETFMAMLRSGRRPDGSAVSKVMPFNALSSWSETDVRALYAYLHTLAPIAAGHR